MTVLIRLTTRPEIDGEAFVLREWHDMSGVERLDLLQDWIGLLSEIYDAERNAQHGFAYTPNQTCLAAIKYQRRR